MLRLWKRLRLRGFTLIELLVVIAIIGVLAGLMLPAIQRVREAGNRTSCLSKLRQLAIACHNHQDQKSSFPPFYGWVGTAWVNGASYGTAHFQLLSFIEQGPIYENAHTTATTTNGWDFYGFWQNTTSSAAGGTSTNRIRLYECPSDPSMPANGQVAGWGACSFPCNAQVFCNVGSDGSVFVGADNAVGSYTTNTDWLNYAKTPDSFGDGGAQTIIFGERYGQCNFQGCLWAYNPDAGGASNVQPWTPCFGAWLNASGSTNGYVMRPDYVAAGQINAVPQAVKFQTQPNPWKIACNVHNAQTGHPGGMNVALGDGSARVVGKNVGNTTWWAAITPNGHDVLGNDW